MRIMHSMERRLQDVERRLENKQRNGQIKEVKFDKEKKRWFVRMEDGEGEEKFLSDWRPWKSFSHGAITVSFPPRIGQRVTMHSPNGESEAGVVEPYHYNPDDPSPHDKEDEILIEVHDPKDKSNKDTKLRILATKDNANITLGESTWDLSKGQIDAKVDGQKVTVTKEKSSMSNDKGKVELAKSGQVTSINEAGAKAILMADGMLRLNV